MGKPHGSENDPEVLPPRTPCFTGYKEVKVKPLKPCSRDPMTSFSWWCDSSKRGGYQFLEERASDSTNKYRIVPWQPIHADKRDDTWPYNCDPIRCAHKGIPACFNRTLHDGTPCYQRPCPKYRLKAPIFKLPPKLGMRENTPKCCYVKRYSPKQPPSYKCRVHCPEEKIKKDRDCQCSTATKTLAIGNSQKELIEQACDPIVCLDSDESIDECSSSISIQDVGTEDKLLQGTLLQSRFFCPSRLRPKENSPCFDETPKLKFRSCQQLFNQRQKQRSQEVNTDCNNQVKNNSMKYQKCPIEDDQKPLIYGALTSFSGNRSLVSRKAKSLASIRQIISEAMKNMLIDGKEIHIIFPNPRGLKNFQRLKSSGALASSEVTLNMRTPPYEKEKLVEKCTEIDNMVINEENKSPEIAVEIPEDKMKVPLEKPPDKALLNIACDLKCQKKNKPPTMRIDIGLAPDRLEVLKTAIETYSDSTQSHSSRRICPTVSQMSSSKKVEFNSKLFQYSPCQECPDTHFELNSYIEGLKALITTYDPFLSPHSPMKAKLLARRYHDHRRLVSTKKFFTHECSCCKPHEKPDVNCENIPFSEGPSRKSRCFCGKKIDERDIIEEMKNWKHNWCNRRRNNKF